jgi:hypothetical protein
MNRRAVGVTLIGIAAFLYGVRYLTAAIFATNAPGWNRDLFQSMLESVGKGPVAASTVALIAGIGYLLFAEFESVIKRNIEAMKKNWQDFPAGGDKE